MQHFSLEFSLDFSHELKREVDSKVKVHVSSDRDLSFFYTHHECNDRFGEESDTKSLSLSGSGHSPSYQDYILYKKRYKQILLRDNTE